MTTGGRYRSDHRPDTAPFEESRGTITGFAYAGDLASEIAAGGDHGPGGAGLLDDMLAIREVEDTIVRLRSGGYDPLPGYDYRGPTHVSIGQEASPVGACSVLRIDDNITSSHRGHGDAVAKGFAAIRTMSDEDAARRGSRARPADPHEELLEQALEQHVYRVIAELFGKDEGYGAGRGGGMHIGDFSTGNLGANAIVGGSVPIATGAAMAHRYERSRPGRVLLRGRRRLRQRRRPRVAQLGCPGAVDEPPGRRQRLRPPGHLLHPEQPLRDDAPDGRRGHGRPPTWPAAPRASPTTTCTPRSWTGWTSSPSVTPCAARSRSAARARARS